MCVSCKVSLALQVSTGDLCLGTHLWHIPCLSCYRATLKKRVGEVVEVPRVAIDQKQILNLGTGVRQNRLHLIN